MIQAIKNFLKRFLPPPVRAFNREIDRILVRIRKLEEQNAALSKKLESANLALQQKQEEASLALSKELKDANFALQQKQEEESLALGKKLDEASLVLLQKQEEIRLVLSKELKEVNLALQQKQEEESLLMSQKLEKASAEITSLASGARNSAKEAVWAEIFNNTISDSYWLHNKTFSPGRWAAGYPVLYVMYRVLNEAKPKRILEIGLGQSTRMIAQYASAHDGVEHFVVEHDSEWITFFNNNFKLTEKTQIVQLERELVPYKQVESVRVFKNFKETFAGKKFDFIFIDAPWGGDMKHYSRIDLIYLLPDCLDESFVILVDDYHRPGEANMVKEIKSILKNAQIAFALGSYSGEKSCALICDEKHSFFKTL